MCGSIQGLMPPLTPIKNIWNHMDTASFFFSKSLSKGQWPLDDCWPHFCCGHMCVILPKYHCVQVPTNVFEYVDAATKKLQPKGQWLKMTPRCPLTPYPLWQHVLLYPKTIVSSSHIKYVYMKPCGYSDLSFFFFKLLTKGQWPLDDLWPHFY